MKLIGLNNRVYNVNLFPYIVNWDKKCRSNFQFEIKQFLRPFLKTHVVCEEFKIPGSKLYIDLIDFTTLQIFEVNGEQHREYNPFFHNDSRLNYLGQIKRDTNKLKWAELNNFKLTEIYPEDLMTKEWFAKNGVIL